MDRPCTPLRVRFEAKFVKGDGCWLWTASRDKKGYGYIWSGVEDRKSLLAHRVAYEMYVGPIADGLHIDHICRNTSCVNPTHLEAVTPAENNDRSDSRSAMQARQTHCLNGHALAGKNLYRWRNQRRCKRCHANRVHAARLLRRENSCAATSAAR